ncbi:MAG: hypothetical protein CO186_05765 [Zetaproteobacteria bacterium CG_4_9_14_3_um_filter_49_83]|nr:MAG: hypothetical protein CO186_05765 [Zetaproteobacteria bacterium CG_4_9_14_3_um_filter_49_83]
MLHPAFGAPQLIHNPACKKRPSQAVKTAAKPCAATPGGATAVLNSADFCQTLVLQYFADDCSIR